MKTSLYDKEFERIVRPQKESMENKESNETGKDKKENRKSSIYNQYNRIHQQGINFNENGPLVMRRMMHMGRISEKLTRMLDSDILGDIQVSKQEFLQKYEDKSELLALQESLQEIREEILSCWMIAEDKE